MFVFDFLQKVDLSIKTHFILLSYNPITVYFVYNLYVYKCIIVYK